MLTESDISIFERLFEVQDAPMDPDTARGILKLKFSESERQRMEVLGDRANEGLLTSDERELYESYIRMGDLLTVLQARARLAQTSSPNDS